MTRNFCFPSRKFSLASPKFQSPLLKNEDHYYQNIGQTCFAAHPQASNTCSVSLKLPKWRLGTMNFKIVLQKGTCRYPSERKLFSGLSVSLTSANLKHPWILRAGFIYGLNHRNLTIVEELSLE